MDLTNPWHFLLVGYVVTVLIETPILLLGLSPRHPLRDRVFAGLWLTACTYPIVILVLPVFFNPVASRAGYLAVAETFAPAAECLLFAATFGPGDRKAIVRDFLAIIVANLASFGVGELWYRSGWLLV